MQITFLQNFSTRVISFFLFKFLPNKKKSQSMIEKSKANGKLTQQNVS